MKDRERLFAATAQSSHDLKVQLNTFDFYHTTPTIFDRNHPPNNEHYIYHHVPIIRVFGALQTGNRVIAHIHGIFPYIFIPYDNQDCFDLHLKIERAVSRSLKKNKNEQKELHTRKQNDLEDRTLSYIANVSICKGIPFYGYHVGYRAFYKISLLNPSFSKRVGDILRSGDIGKAYDVYEGHINNGLQFLSDFNLFGCGWLKVNDLFIRLPILDDDSKRTDELVDLLSGFRTNDLGRVGYSDFEFDILAQNITNRLELEERELHCGFVEKFQSAMDPTIFIQSTKDLWRDGEYQRRLKNQAPYSSTTQFKRASTPAWVEGTENKTMFDYIKALDVPYDLVLDFESFLKPDLNLEGLPTVFGIIDELFYEPDFQKAPEDTTFDETEDIDEKQNSAEYQDFDYGVKKHGELADFVLGSSESEEIEKETDEENDLSNHEDFGNDSMLDPVAKRHTNAALGHSVTDLQLTQELNKRFHPKRTFTQAFISQKPMNSQNFGLVKILRDSSKFTYDIVPPSDLDFDAVDIPKIQYDDPFYSDAPLKPFVHGLKKFKLESRKVEYLTPAEFRGVSLKQPHIISHKESLCNLKSYYTLRNFSYFEPAPTFQEIEKVPNFTLPPSQLIISQKYKFNTQKQMERRPDSFVPLSLLLMELFVITREDFKPDPSKDEIQGIFWRFSSGAETREGMLILSSTAFTTNIESELFECEFEMVERFFELTRDFDPDLLAGYEVHSSSWGYLIDRCKIEHDFDAMKALSRVNYKGHEKFGDQWGATHTSAIQITGRHILNIWRHLRELKLQRNNIEYVTFHLLHERIPHFSEKSLTQMYQGNDSSRVLKHFIRMVQIDARLIEAADMIAKAAEEARLIGIDFYDVFYRGSQYKVESLMVRIAKAENFVLFTASKNQIRRQKPLECIPLVMEPLSAYYKSPLVVLDFQSLYPSIMIAYNYCYSTLLGRLRNYKAGQFNEFGTTKVKHPPGLLKLLENDILLSPNGLMFVKASVRKSLLAKMLEDLLDTRQMLKSTMNILDHNTQKLYNNRQLALKLTANVTYGYTSASFSGRMPCSDIADAIVQTGRETLENAIRLIEDCADWGAKVVYGDTDSLFVYLPGKTQEEAFDIGNQIARRVTESNPDPVTLKFEKVYHPSLLMAKKRYVGYSYEHLNDPSKFDAKGIETVRRDGHAAQQYIVEKSLRILFETNNLTTIKDFVLDQFKKILQNDVSIQDFCFAKNVKLGYYKNLPPGATVSMKKLEIDPRAVPQYKERVPYVIVKKPGAILRERATAPETFIKFNHSLDSKYYIERTLIPPLERIFNLMGVDIRQWYNEMPRRFDKQLLMFNTDNCAICGRLTNNRICIDCRKNELNTILNLRMMTRESELRLKETLAVCRQCSDLYLVCESLDCPNYFKRIKDTKNLKEHDALMKEIMW